MILMLIAGLVCSSLLAMGVYCLLDEGPEGFIVFTLLGLFLTFFLIAVPLFESYETYVEMKGTYDATVTQYRNSVEMYEDKAVVHLTRDSITDFRYKGYQESVSSLIKDLRNTVAEYNQTYIEKKTYSSNLFLSWYTIGPSEDMKPIRLETGGGLSVE